MWVCQSVGPNTWHCVLRARSPKATRKAHRLVRPSVVFSIYYRYAYHVRKSRLSWSLSSLDVHRPQGHSASRKGHQRREVPRLFGIRRWCLLIININYQYSNCAHAIWQKLDLVRDSLCSMTLSFSFLFDLLRLWFIKSTIFVFWTVSTTNRLGHFKTVLTLDDDDAGPMKCHLRNRQKRKSFFWTWRGIGKTERKTSEWEPFHHYIAVLDSEHT